MAQTPAVSRAAAATELVADASAQSFAVRPSYDSGGAAPLSFYVGYSDATLTTPEPAQGQASWYNFNIAETAAFSEAAECLPYRKNGAEDTLADAQAYVQDYVGAALGRAATGDPPPTPLVPGARGLCAERLAGFAQSLYPPTATIPERSSDSYLDKPSAAAACRDQHAAATPDAAQCLAYKRYWPSFAAAARGLVRDGGFSAESHPDAQHSLSVLFGAGDGAIVSIGLSVMASDVELRGATLTVAASAMLKDVCIGVTPAGCTLRIESIRQTASVSKTAGAPAGRAHRTIVLGVHGSGAMRDVTASDLFLNQAQFSSPPYFGLSAVSETHGCDASVADPDRAVADAGGIVLFGSGGPGQQGGSIMIGGACASARLVEAQASTGNRFVPDAGSVGTPSQTITVPGGSGVGTGGGPLFGAPRVVTRTVTRYAVAGPLAWRTAQWWGSALGALTMLGLLTFVYRRAPFVAPLVRALDRFARQFVRG